MLLIKQGYTFNIPVETYLCDTEADLVNIPSNAPAGSMVYILSDSSGNTIKKVKNSNGTWVKAEISGNYPTDFTEPITVLTPTTDYNPATKKYVDDAIGGIVEMEYEVVAELPSTGVKGTIYLVPHNQLGVEDRYVEYLWITNKFEKIGDTDIALRNYIQIVTGATGKVPKFDGYGQLLSTGYELNKTVPNDAVFTDTTYDTATQLMQGLMSANDKIKLDGLENTYLKKTDLVSLTAQEYENLQEKTAPYYFIIEE